MRKAAPLPIRSSEVELESYGKIGVELGMSLNSPHAGIYLVLDLQIKFKC